MAYNSETGEGSDLRTPVRNRYFYGKLLDVHHFELETEYFNHKRWLLNRLIVGPGVVCGLDVELTDDNKSVIVQPGVAIDRCGQEIIVTAATKSEPLPSFPRHDASLVKQEGRGFGAYCEEEYAHVALCYEECASDPAPALVSDCETARCTPGSIRERYRVEIRKGYARPRKSSFPDMVEKRRISYRMLIDYVTRGCRESPEDCCIPLANVRLRYSDDGWKPEIDIYIRRIVYTNRLLFELLESLVYEEQTD